MKWCGVRDDDQIISNDQTNLQKNKMVMLQEMDVDEAYATGLQ